MLTSNEPPTERRAGRRPNSVRPEPASVLVGVRWRAAFARPRRRAGSARHGRSELPWQNTRDPYRVWLSEVMLQQTQVTTVLGYFERFLARFPDVAALAGGSRGRGARPVERARLLQPRAQHAPLRAGGGGAIRRRVSRARPRNSQRLPGIGRSTAAAIAAFCFGERVAILDGNVKRVLDARPRLRRRPVDGSQERALWAQPPHCCRKAALRTSAVRCGGATT